MTDETPKPDSNPQEDTKAKANLFWIALLVALTGTGIYYFLVDDVGLSWTGIVLVILALVLFWTTDRDRGAPPLWLGIFARLRSASDVVLTVIAVVFSISAALMGVYLEHQSSQVMEDIAVPLWIAGGLIIFLMHCHISWETIRAWWRDYHREILAVALMTAVAAMLRFYQLDKIPNMIDGDEGWTGMAALKLMGVDVSFYTSPFSSLEGFGRPYLNLFAAAIDFFGRDKFGLRFIPAVGGTLAIPATYIFARRLFGVRTAVIAALLLMVSHAHIHFSRTAAVGYQQATWLAPLELYCLLKGMEERKRSWIVMAGLLLGLHFNVYFDAQILIPTVFVFLVMAAIISPPQIAVGDKVITRPALPLRENLRNLPWLFGSILIMVLPALVWIFLHPTNFGARWAKEGSIQSGWLLKETGIVHPLMWQPLSALLILWDRFVHVCMTIFILPFQDFYWAPLPILDILTGALFAVGAFLALRRTRDPRILLLNGWFWSAVVAVGLFAIPPAADSYRLLMVVPAMCILAALGWTHIISLAERLAKAPWRMVVSASVIMVLLVSAVNLKTYYIDFGRSCLYGGQYSFARPASWLGDYLRAQPAFDQAYLLGDEKLSYGIYPSVDYLSGSIPMTNMGVPFTPPNMHGSTLFIIVPSRESERVAVQAFAPGGETTRVSDCGKLMFLAYRVYIP